MVLENNHVRLRERARDFRMPHESNRNILPPSIGHERVAALLVPES